MGEKNNSLLHDQMCAIGSTAVREKCQTATVGQNVNESVCLALY